ncbi:hypothetical protein SNE40_003957 [Patella caerulea]|uniref:Uncharacterized protein n=1 Tax=Patella caerulea TaxID=87958 RepID=A0AAN8KHU0_PATCE
MIKIAHHMDLNELTGNTLVPELFAVSSKSSNQVEAVNSDSQAQLSTGPIIEKSYNKEDEPDQDISITDDSTTCNESNFNAQPVDVRHKMGVITEFYGPIGKSTTKT